MDGAELALDPAYAASAAGAGEPPPAVVRRNLDVLRGWAGAPPHATADGERRIRLRFFLRPVELLERQGRVAGVRFARTAPDGSGGVRDTGEYEDIEAQLVLRAVGYRGTPLPGLPFDPVHGTVPHVAGRVVRDGRTSPGEYVAGWIKRGPTGVIGSNRSCAKETVASLVEDAPLLLGREVPADPLAVLRDQGLRPVEWDGWLSIERAESALGRSLGRGRVKIPDWSGLLDAARGGP